MATSAVLSPSNQRFVIGGFPILGRATGTYVTFTYDVGDQVTVVPGVDSNGYFVDTENFAATMVVTLLQNSAENAILSGLFAASRAAPNGLIYPIIVKSPAGTFSGFGRVAGIPPLEFSDGAVTLPWKIVSAHMEGGLTGVPTAPLP